MAGTYCGKTCSECSFKESLGCQGCKVGPGAGIFCECELAKCCKKCGHEACDTCMNSSTCKLYRGRTNAAELRLKRKEIQDAERARLSAMAPGMIKYFMVLFVCLIVNAVLSFFSDDLFVKNLPVLKIVGISLIFIVQLVYYIVLLRMSSTEETYKNAACFGMIGIAAFLPVNIIMAYSDEFSAFTVLNLVITLILTAARYFECNAHSALLSGVSDLSDKWERHWKWYLGTMIAKIASVLFVLISPILGLLLMLAALIATVMVDIQRMIYLYMSMEDFKAIYNKR